MNAANPRSIINQAVVWYFIVVFLNPSRGKLPRLSITFNHTKRLISLYIVTAYVPSMCDMQVLLSRIEAIIRVTMYIPLIEHESDCISVYYVYFIHSFSHKVQRITYLAT